MKENRCRDFGETVLYIMLEQFVRSYAHFNAKSDARLSSCEASKRQNRSGPTGREEKQLAPKKTPQYLAQSSFGVVDSATSSWAPGSQRWHQCSQFSSNSTLLTEVP